VLWVDGRTVDAAVEAYRPCDGSSDRWPARRAPVRWKRCRPRQPSSGPSRAKTRKP